MTALIIATGIGTALFLPFVRVAGWLMGLPSGWLSVEGWRTLSWWQKSGVNLGAGMCSFIVTAFVLTVLARRYWDK